MCVCVCVLVHVLQLCQRLPRPHIIKHRTLSDWECWLYWLRSFLSQERPSGDCRAQLPSLHHLGVILSLSPQTKINTRGNRACFLLALSLSPPALFFVCWLRIVSLIVEHLSYGSTLMSRYEGSYEDGKKSGNGKFWYPDGSTYEGDEPSRLVFEQSCFSQR